MVEIMVKEDGAWKNLIFSGDMGQWNKPFVKNPTLFERADYMVMESTYGDRDHDHPEDVGNQLAQVINRTVEAGGTCSSPPLPSKGRRKSFSISAPWPGRIKFPT